MNCQNNHCGKTITIPSLDFPEQCHTCAEGARARFRAHYELSEGSCRGNAYYWALVGNGTRSQPPRITPELRVV
jgi:hypothetical protein